ncbi:MAG: hypothetical protein ABIH20_01445 [Candidatus Diapherotrites archaeon]
MKKGIVISFDALLALLVFISILILTNSYLAGAQFEEKNNLILKESAMDITTVLEKNGEFEWAVQNNKINSIRSYINKLPNSLCAEVKIFNNNDYDNPELSVLRPSCNKNFNNSATFNRSFVERSSGNTNFYVGRVTTWVKVSS